MMRPVRMMLLASALATMLAGCETTGSAGTEVCAVWRPISWSVKDTPETVDGVKGSNARRAAWCR